jgi:hypothetical protein
MYRARDFCDEDSLQAELIFLRDIFKQNGYKDWQTYKALNRRPHLDQPDNIKSNAFLQFIGTTFNRISRVLA